MYKPLWWSPMAKFDQEVSIVDVKSSLMGDLQSVGGSTSVPGEPLVSASATNAVMETSVREMQSTVRTIVAYIEWVYGNTFDPGSAISTWTVKIVGHVVSRSQLSVPDVRTACERRKRKSRRKALVQFNELVMLMTMEKPKDKGDVEKCTDPTRYLVDLTKSLVVRLQELSKLVLFVACRRSSEVVPETLRASEACRGSRIQPKQLRRKAMLSCCE